MLMRSLTKYQLGFTLVELVIVIAIFGILAAFAIPSYNQMTQNTMIRTATDSITTGLQIARAEAVKRNANVQFDFRTRSAWTVCLAPTGGGNCPTTDDATTIQSRSERDGSSDNVTIVESNNNYGPYIFNGYGLLTNGPLTITIGNQALAGSRDLQVVVGAGGAVKSCDPALDPTGTDPRRC